MFEKSFKPTIWKKILLNSVIFLVLIIIIALAGFIQLGSVSRLSETNRNIAMFQINIVNNVYTLFYEAEDNINDYIVIRGEEYKGVIIEILEKIDGYVKSLEPISGQEIETDILNLKELLTEYKNEFSNIVAMEESHKEMTLAFARLSIIAEKITKQQKSFNSNIYKLLNRIANEEKEQIDQTTLRFILFALILIILGLVSSLYLAGRIAKPIMELRDVAAKIREGRLSIRLKNNSKDEIGELSLIIKKMAYRLSVSFRQIKDEKQNAEKEKVKVEAVLNNIAEGVVALNKKKRVMMMNRAAEKIFFKPLESLRGKIFTSELSFFEGEDKPFDMNKTLIAPAIKKKKQQKRNIFLKNENSDVLIPFDATASPFYLKDKLLGVIITFRDIKKEIAMDKTKNDFISLTSHQMRTPLTGVKWNLEMLLRSKKLKPSEEDAAVDALASVDRMVNLVNDLLNVSRLNSGKIAVNPSTFDVVDNLKDFIKKEAEPIAREKKQKILLSSSHKQINIYNDPILLKQVFSNIISNALHYSGERTDIQVKVGQIGKKVRIMISDKGIGMTKKDQKNIFKKFYRSDRASKYCTTGSGLGLFIVKKIADVCQGSIKLDSKEDKGTTFLITFPIKTSMEVKKGKELFNYIS